MRIESYEQASGQNRTSVRLGRKKGKMTTLQGTSGGLGRGNPFGRYPGKTLIHKTDII
jgi:hypothetical protein